jgi:CRISPR-associated protein Cmr2
VALGYWQAKIWGLLHDPVFKALHSNAGRGGNSFWRDLEVMKLWGKHNPEESGKHILKHIKLADYITSASDRAAIGSLTRSVDYNEHGLELHHLLSGKELPLKLKDKIHQQVASKNRADYLNGKEEEIFNAIPEELRTGTTEQDAKKLFWWLWRCLPVQASRTLGKDENLMLMPAETRLPDGSIWSHASLTAAFAGALAGYHLTNEDVINKWPNKKEFSHAYLVSLTFSPVQELIKASRKMRDFWAGSWILHYLSAKVCWQLALQYGPDSFIYPSLYQQPLIDLWLLDKYKDFSKWIDEPSEKSLLTAGFPNVIVMVLPKGKVEAAMQRADSILKEEWKQMSHLVFEELQTRHWMPELIEDSKTWNPWLDNLWQTYYAGVPIGKEGELLTSSEIHKDEGNIDENQPEDEEKAQSWRNKQNELYNLSGCKALFLEKEQEFLRKAGELRRQKWKRPPLSSNVGSWWNHAFDYLRLTLTAAKNARDWEIPTAFGPRSTVSGLGPVVHPDGNNDWITEGQTQKYWKRNAGLFDGIEQLNATETVKRGLSEILPELIGIDREKTFSSYPDLTAGVAGYLKISLENGENQPYQNFERSCQAIIDNFPWAREVIDEMRGKWGIPWSETRPQQYHPRLLNAGWLVEDAETDELSHLQRQLDKESRQQEPDAQIIDELKKQIATIKIQFRTGIDEILGDYYPNNNPADWYVIAAGDGDGMSEWLKGKQMKPYRDYIAQSIQEYADNQPKSEEQPLEKEVRQAFKEFIELDKRMGPSTHNALSRSLLDFSNQLVPYLTEQRYAGRLIYSGGDDVLAYTNLWEWDKWLWDIRQCFKGDKDPHQEFNNAGDYWQWKSETPPKNLAKRPLFTMGNQATISFGIVIAHHSVPLAIALENLWEAEKKAKEHIYKACDGKKVKKDAVQVRVLYGNGNVLQSTAKFDVFPLWQQLLAMNSDASLFEGVASLWEQHPVPTIEAIKVWVNAFSSRRENLATENKEAFPKALTNFLQHLWLTTENDSKNINEAVRSWMKLAAFMTRKRKIKIGGSI